MSIEGAVDATRSWHVALLAGLPVGTLAAPVAPARATVRRNASKQSGVASVCGVVSSAWRLLSTK
eukprot:3764467-Alexandrium_andersonii.AAC.1